MERHEQIEQTIQGQINESTLIVPSMHRIALNAVADGAKHLHVKSKYTQGAIRFTVTVPEKSLFDTPENDGKTLKVEAIVDNEKTGDSYKRVAEIENIHFTGGASYTLVMPRVDWEKIDLYAVSLNVGNHLFKKLI